MIFPFNDYIAVINIKTLLKSVWLTMFHANDNSIIDFAIIK